MSVVSLDAARATAPAAVPPTVRLPAPSVRIQVMLPSELVDRLKTIGISRGIGLSTIVRMLLYASLEQ